MATIKEMKGYYEKVKNRRGGKIAVDILKEAFGISDDRAIPEAKEKTESRIEDPEFLFSIAFDEVRAEMIGVMREKRLNDEELDNLIKKEYPAEYQKLWGELYEKINTDIWGKYEDGVLTVGELEVWKKDLERWKGAWLGVLAKILNKN